MTLVRTILLSFLAAFFLIGKGFAQEAGSCDNITSIESVEVLIEANGNFGMGNHEDYAICIKKLFPQAKYIYLRWNSKWNGDKEKMDQMKKKASEIKGKYSSINIGFQPDNTTASYEHWGCGNIDSQDQSTQCVFKSIIQLLNELNKESVFTSFAIEQSDILLLGDKDIEFKDRIENQKKCLSGEQVVDWCPEDKQLKTPLFTNDGSYGYTAPSCQEATSPYDLVFPQMYNLYSNNKVNVSHLNIKCNDGSNECILVDAAASTEGWLNGDEYAPAILCSGTAGTGEGSCGDMWIDSIFNHVKTITPENAARIVATLVKAKTGDWTDINCMNKKTSFAFSGESKINSGASGSAFLGQYNNEQLFNFFNELNSLLTRPFALYSFDTLQAFKDYFDE